MVPVAIIVAGILIAGAVFLNKSGDNGNTNNNGNGNGNTTEEIDLDPVTVDDHILGSPDAAVMFVEYSDLECPFCKDAHSVMHEIIDKYGASGEVAWVYRHFPITQIHPKAVKEAEATECAYDQGGNTAFWEYTDRIFDITPSNNGLDLEQLPVIAEEIGLDVEEFESCLDSGKFASKVEEQFNSARKAGAQGTPHFVVISKSGEMVPVPGFLPFAQMDALVQQLLQLESGASVQ